MGDNLYLVLNRKPIQDIATAINLVDEYFGKLNSVLAPSIMGMSPGFIVETREPIPQDDQKILGIVPWI